MQKIISFKIIPIKVSHKGKHFQSAKVECTVNNSEWDQACKLDGVFVYITDHKEQKNGVFVMSAYDVINHYKNKYVIENDFRDLKNIIDIRPLFGLAGTSMKKTRLRT
jgi:transposase